MPDYSSNFETQKSCTELLLPDISSLSVRGSDSNIVNLGSNCACLSNTLHECCLKGMCAYGCLILTESLLHKICLWLRYNLKTWSDCE